MPDILIRNYEYPKNCASCEWLVQRFPGALYWCKRTDTMVHPTWPSANLNPKPGSCPLHELPPHGDLIDRDAVIEDLQKDDTYQNWAFRQMLGKQPVVVPAERSGND